MNPESPPDRDRLIESISIGLLEALSFSGLFFTPYLGSQDLQVFWVFLVAMRFLWLFVPRYFAGWSTVQTLKCRWRDQALVLGSALVHQIPFWLAAKFFPIHPGQAEYAELAFVSQLLLFALGLVLCPLRTHWLPGLLTICGTLVWFQGEAEMAWIIGVGVGLVLMVAPRYLAGGGRITTRLRAFAICVSVTWPLAVALISESGDSYSAQSLGRLIYAWGILAGLSTLIFSESRRLEFGLMSYATSRFDRALRGVLSRRSAGSALAWLPLAILSVRDVSDLSLPLTILILWSSSLALAGSGPVSWAGQRRWSVWAFVLLWGCEFGRNEEKLLFLACAILGWWLSSLRAAVPRQVAVLAEMGYWQLSSVLRQGLWIEAPDSLKERVLEASEPSVELDSQLAAAAPKGFSARLLQRLKDAPEEPDED